MTEEGYSIDLLMNCLRVIRGVSLKDYEEVTEFFDTLCDVEIPSVLDHCDCGNLEGIVQDLRDVLKAAHGIRGRMDLEETPDEIREKWFERNFEQVNLRDVAEEMPTWTEIVLTRRGSEHPIPPYLYRCTANRDESELPWTFTDDSEWFEELADEWDFRIFTTRNEDKVYIGSEHRVKDWLEGLYDAVYVPKRTCYTEDDE